MKGCNHITRAVVEYEYDVFDKVVIEHTESLCRECQEKLIDELKQIKEYKDITWLVLWDVFYKLRELNLKATTNEQCARLLRIFCNNSARFKHIMNCRDCYGNVLLDESLQCHCEWEEIK